MLTHLYTNGSTIDDISIQELNSAMGSNWNPTEIPTTKFKYDDKIKQKLEKFGIHQNSQICLALIKASVKCLCKFNAAIFKWETKPKADQTFTKFCPFLVKVFQSKHTQNVGISWVGNC